MKNSEKYELIADVKKLIEKRYSKKEAVEALVSFGYVKSTASRYWDVFSEKYSPNLNKQNTNTITREVNKK